MSWLRRSLQRQRDLARGVDADLVRANRRRWKLAAGFFCLAFLLRWFALKLALQHVVQVAITLVAILLAIASLVLFWWAWKVDTFLEQPDPEPPPSIFKQ